MARVLISSVKHTACSSCRLCFNYCVHFHLMQCPALMVNRCPHVLCWEGTRIVTDVLIAYRLRLSVNSAHHIFGYLQAVAVALPRLDLQHGQTLWLPLLTLHIHAIATLSPILQVGFFFLLLFSAVLIWDAVGCQLPLPDP